MSLLIRSVLPSMCVEMDLIDLMCSSSSTDSLRGRMRRKTRRLPRQQSGMVKMEVRKKKKKVKMGSK